MKNKNKQLKKDLKDFMRGGIKVFDEDGNVKIDPLTNKPLLTPPRAITAYDIIKRFDRNLSLDEAIIFLITLEHTDRSVTKTPINDVNNDGVEYAYHYQYKKKNRSKNERGD